MVEDSGEKIFRRTHTLKNGKRYIISSWDKESWELNDVITLRAPDEGLSIETHAATSYMYVDGVPFFTQDAVATNSANIWRFETSGNEAEDEGYLVCEHTGYGRTWCLGMGWDLTTLGTTIGRVPDGPMGYTDSAASLFSAEWRWGAGLVSVRTSGSEHYWVGYERASGSWKIISGSDWDGDAHLNAYLFEETNNVATAILSDKVGYVGVNGTTLPTKIIKTWSTGLVEYVPLELSMLSTSDGSPVDTSTAGNYSNLSVTYNGVVICTDYTLAVGTEVTATIEEGKYFYTLVDAMTLGKEYLIVSRNTAGKAFALASAGYNVKATTFDVSIEMDANGIPCIRSDVAVPAAAVWKFFNDNNPNGETWLEQPESLWDTGNDRGRNFLSFHDIRPNGEEIDKVFNTVGTTLYSGNWFKNWPVVNIAFHSGSGANYPALKGWTSLRGWYNGTYAYLTFDKHDAAFVSVGDAYRKWGEEVYIYEKTPITSVTYEALGTSGKVNVGDGATTRVGTSVEIRYPDGSVVVEKVTADMLYLNGNALTDGDLASPIRMPGLTLKYNGQTLTTNFTLDVMSETENDYPEFPAPGAVRVNKQLGKPDFIFNQTGVAKVDLAVTGTPKQTPMDVLVILDTSSSVVDNYVETGETRLEVMRQALGDMIDTLQAPNPDGSIPDICLAVSQFNDYTYFNQYNGLAGHEIFGDREIPKQYNGKISDFTNIHAMDNFDMSLIQGHGGTNYDVAFQTAYEMLDARKQQYATIGEREQIVVFMTDGVCFQYNYLSYRHGAKDSKIWEKWMLGGLTAEELASYVPTEIPFAELYNGYGPGKHWMAEVIKAGTSDDTASGQIMYPVIWNENRDTGEIFDGNKHYRMVQGLGATIYSIGFGIDVDGDYNSKVGKQVLANIASDASMFYDANDKQELRNAFSDIGRSVRKAATDAYVKDQMGKFFDLQMGQVKNSGGDVFAAPSITIQTYDLYKTDEVGSYVNGVLVTMEMVGTRKSTLPAATLETISFSADGKTVTSSVLGSANILANGVISGKYFYYNTNKTTAKNIVVNGKTVSLEPETIYWHIGDITEQEVALSYYVYLENSMGEDDVGCEAGIYDTNNYADLHYINYNGNLCKQETQTPKLPWETATVGYAFYLVDENGNVIVNQTTGETGGFANRIPVTTVVTNELKLNVDSGEYTAIKAKDVLPDGYTLFDEEVSYKVHVHSGDSTGGYWTIDATSGLKPTTYVTGYYGTEATTELNSSNDSYSYSHTTVWFAVKYTVQATPDAVVIDYGLPVNIHILANDLFPTTAMADGIFCGKVNYSFKGISEVDQPTVVLEATGKFGSAKLDKETGIICYTLNISNGMQMNQEEVFSYRVPYTYTTMINGKQTTEQRYYYSSVTIIPAANIYYEDNFFKFTDSTAQNNGTGVWSSASGSGDQYQAEDRPGTDSMPEIDKDFVYGYDSVNGSYNEYSLGSYHKVMVDATSGGYTTAPTVQFTFTGTGFDLISLTNSDSGMIMVDVVGPETHKLVVDNYYGYTYTEDGWVVDPNAKDCLYQVPVIKLAGLKYGTYTVTIRVGYMSLFDHDANGNYSFWMDAVRIYNPANVNGGTNATIGGAYEKDQESNPVFVTIRDILVGADSFSADKNTAGSVFIDGKLNNGASVTDYANQGPNNETYLAGGQAVAFNLITNTNPASIQSIQIGAKLAKGSQAKLYYNTKELVTLTTATNMFYKLKGLTWTQIEGTNMWKSSTIVLSNASTGTDNIISLTDVKITSGKAIQLVTESASAVSDPVAMLEEVQGPAIVLCADGLTVERTDAVMKAIEESTKAEAENPEQKPEDDNQDTSSPSTGDPAELLLPALTVLAMLCFFEIMVLIKLDNKAKMEVRR